MIGEKPIDETDYADHDLVLAQIRLQPKPIFRRPHPLPDFCQRENAESSTPSSGPDRSQSELPTPVSLVSVPGFPSDTIADNPVMLKNDGGVADESGPFAKATSAEPEIGPARTLSSHTRGEPEALGCSNSSIIAETPNKPFNRPTFPSAPASTGAGRRRRPPQSRDGRKPFESFYFLAYSAIRIGSLTI